MKIIMLGAPGAGKGTQAKQIAEQYNIPHISTGDIFRANIKNGTELGKKAKEYMDQGLLVPDELVVDLVVDRIEKDDCQKGFIDRMSGRRSCRECGAIFHAKYNPPKSEGICDICSGELILRDDDKEETVKKRLDVYHEQTAPLISHYKSAGSLHEIDGTRHIDVVFDEIKSILEA